jgi:hypothetical protein
MIATAADGSLRPRDRSSAKSAADKLTTGRWPIGVAVDYIARVEGEMRRNNVQPGPVDTDMNPASGEFAMAFIDDLASRMKNRIQLSSDALSSYADAVERAFGGGCRLRADRKGICRASGRRAA